ncbi:MAG: sigma-70 family RNA polymerase sigma factor [Phycisphaeraceae bacterium]|nr:sigma-70 family RNA polymerase sigma factor [Phycisphaeraceae bacterium]
MTDVTRILNAIEQGEEKAADRLLPLVYDELRRLAAHKLGQESPGQTLQATALVHEAYLRLTGETAQNWTSRRHFFSAAAEAMRRVLIDHARRKKSQKRGGNHQRISLDDISPLSEASCSVEDLVALDEALTKFSLEDSTKADVVKLRYFAGLNIEQTAEVLGISATTTKLHWAYARAWLLREIG